MQLDTCRKLNSAFVGVTLCTSQNIVWKFIVIYLAAMREYFAHMYNARFSCTSAKMLQIHKGTSHVHAPCSVSLNQIINF